MKPARLPIILLGSLMLSLLSAFAQNAPASASARTEQYLAVLKSDASQKEKADACRELAVIGTPEAVSVLAGLLSDEKLAHMARYALEPIPSPSVDEALRQALGQLKGRALVGVIGSIGVRRDLKAIEGLARLLEDADSDVAQGAARALGRLGTVEAVQFLKTALPKTTVANRLAFFEGLFRCAEVLMNNGKRDEALAIYDQLRSGDAPYQVRVGALSQAISIRQKEGLPILTRSLRNEDYVTFAAAVKTAQSLPGTEVSQILTDELPQLTDDRQILILQTLGMRKDVSTVPAISTRAQTGSKRVQLAALKTLAEIGAPDAASVFTAHLKDADSDIAQTAQECLASLPGQGVDATITAMINSTVPENQLIGLELLGRRRMADATPNLMKTAQDNSPEVRLAALKRLGELGGATDLSPLFSLLVKTTAAPEIEAADQALTAIYTRLDPASTADKSAGDQFQAQVRKELEAAPASRKSMLLGLVSLAEIPQSLEIIRGALKDDSGDVRSAAIRVLSKWKASEVDSDLLAVAKNSGQANERTLGLRGYLGLASNTDLPVEKRLAMCRDASPLIQRDEEKRLLLGALGNIPAVEAAGMAAPLVASEATREEASAAIVSIADKLLKENQAVQSAPSLIEPLQKVIQANASPQLTRRAKNLLTEAQNKAGK